MRERRGHVLLLASLLAAAGCSKSEPGRFKVAVTVSDRTGPLAGQKVRVHAADGAPQGEGQTGPDGRAEVDADRDSSLVVVEDDTGWGRAVTVFAGLEPGEEHRVIEQLDPSEDYVTGAVWQWGRLDVTLPGAVEGASSYQIDFGAWYVTTAAADVPVPVNFFVSETPPFTVLAIAFADGGVPLAYTVVKDVPLASTVDGWAGAVTMPAWRTDWAPVTVDVTDAQAGSELAFVVLSPAVHGGLLRNGPWGDAAVVSPGGSVSFPLAVPRDTTDSAQLLVRDHFEDLVLNQSGSYTYRVENGVPLAADRSVSLAALPPRISNPRIEASGDRVVASWDADASDPGLDATFLLATWWNETGTLRWNVVLPPGRTQFTFPKLPDELAAWRASATGWSVSVEAIDLDCVAGYGQFKKDWGLRFFRDRRPTEGRWVERGSIGYNSDPAP